MKYSYGEFFEPCKNCENKLKDADECYEDGPCENCPKYQDYIKSNAEKKEKK